MLLKVAVASYQSVLNFRCIYGGNVVVVSKSVSSSVQDGRFHKKPQNKTNHEATGGSPSAGPGRNATFNLYHSTEVTGASDEFLQ